MLWGLCLGLLWCDFWRVARDEFLFLWLGYLQCFFAWVSPLSLHLLRFIELSPQAVLLLYSFTLCSYSSLLVKGLDELLWILLLFLLLELVLLVTILWLLFLIVISSFWWPGSFLLLYCLVVPRFQGRFSGWADILAIIVVVVITVVCRCLLWAESG